MFTLNAEHREPSLKPKQLRRKGIIPGVLYGKDLEQSLSIQFSQKDVDRFLRSNSAGSRAELHIGDQKLTALLREVSYQTATDQLEHLSFQTLQAGEVVTSAARIVLLNREKVMGVIHQPLSEISYRALPSHLVDKIEIDLDGMQVGDSVRVDGLDIAKNPDIEILSPPDAVVLAIADTHRPVDLPETEGEDEASEPQGE